MIRPLPEQMTNIQPITTPLPEKPFYLSFVICSGSGRIILLSGLWSLGTFDTPSAQPRLKRLAPHKSCPSRNRTVETRITAIQAIMTMLLLGCY
jgi:hypothetical protein